MKFISDMNNNTSCMVLQVCMHYDHIASSVHCVDLEECIPIQLCN